MTTQGSHGPLTKANVIVTTLIVALVAGSFALLFANLAPAGPGTSGLVAVVHDADGVACELPLDQDARQTIQSDLGTNVVAVEGGRVFMAEADCDGQDCLHQAALDSPGGQIICLPHRLWIEMVGDGGSQGQMDESAVESAQGLDVISR